MSDSRLAGRMTGLGHERCNLGKNFHTIVFDHEGFIMGKRSVLSNGGENVFTCHGERFDFLRELHRVTNLSGGRAGDP